MSDDEFAHLQNFGKTIENRCDDYSAKKKEKKPIVLINKSNLKYILKKISKRIIFLIIRIKKHSDNIHFKRPKFFSFTGFIRKKNYVKSYKIIEKKKQRRNKIIIIRKRVPFRMDANNIENKSDLEHLIKFTFDSAIYYNKKRTNAENCRLKTSVWDFKIK